MAKYIEHKAFVDFMIARGFYPTLVARAIEDMPTADVVEVRHGYWYIPEYEYLGCSECGEWYYTGADSTAEAKERLANGECYPYCPHCGAKMDGGVK